VLDTPEKTLVYCGNYKNSKLLLSRISWTLNDFKRISFFYFSVQDSYCAIINKMDKSISAIYRWERILLFPIDGQWKTMIHYIHDPILSNKCKEILYKIYTQVLSVGANIQKFGHPSECPFCGQKETEIHLFVSCTRVSQLWAWLDACLLTPFYYPQISSLTQWKQLIGFNSQMSPQTIKVWKLFHAETIRSIWASRCRKVFDNKDSHCLKLRVQIVARVEYALNFCLNSFKKHSKGEKAKNKIIKLWSHTILVAAFPVSRSGLSKCKLKARL
jgi:hypothetical protein